jgi:hypothetical protein
MSEAGIPPLEFDDKNPTRLSPHLQGLEAMFNRSRAGTAESRALFIRGRRPAKASNRPTLKS